MQMSIFDVPPNSKSPKFEFFRSLEKNMEPILKKLPLFECYIFVLKQSGIYVKCPIRIIDEKLILFKNQFSKKYLDFHDLFHLKSQETPQKTHKFMISLEKFSEHWRFFIEEKKTFVGIMEILKHYCIMSDFETNYETMYFLGKGHFAQVFCVKNRETKKMFAAKIFRKDDMFFEKNKNLISQEIKITRFLPDSSHVVKNYEVYEEKNGVIMVMELLGGRDLYHYVKNNPKMPEQQIFEIFMQILKGVCFLHAEGVFHRDLKPDNILFAEAMNMSSLKITDFSLAEYISDQKRFSIQCGTPGFMAPEILNGEKYNEKVDIFSLGCILYLLFSGKTVFRGRNLQELIEKNQAGKIIFKTKDWENYSKEAKQITKRMLNKNQALRLSFFDISKSNWVNLHSNLKSFKKLSTNFESVDKSEQKKSFKRHKTFLTQKTKLNCLSDDGVEVPVEIQDINDEGKIKLPSAYQINVKLFSSNSVNDLREISEKMSQNKSYCPSFLDYSLNSFLINSKSDYKSSNSSSLNKRSLNHYSIEKKSSFYSSEGFSLSITPLKQTSIESGSEIFNQKNSESLIFETKREALESFEEFVYVNSCDTRMKGDINLQLTMENLSSLPFKGKF